MPAWLPHVITIALSVVASWLTFWVRFERFQSMDAQRERDWLLWRGNTDKLGERLDQRIRDHEKYCDERWNVLNKEVGEMKGRLGRQESQR
jgi:hypothetical protein